MAEPTFLTKQDVSDLFKVHIQTVDYWVRNQQIPYHRLGQKKVVRFEKTELLSWFEKRKNIEYRHKPKKPKLLNNISEMKQAEAMVRGTRRRRA